MIEEAVPPTIARLDAQLAWYDRAAERSQRAFRILKLTQIVVGAAIPVAAALGASAAAAGVLGGVIVVLEGVQQLFRFQENWLRYRRAAETLRSEKHLFEAAAGAYAGAEKPLQLLAERIEELFVTELTSWATEQRPKQDKAASAD